MNQIELLTLQPATTTTLAEGVKYSHVGGEVTGVDFWMNTKIFF